MYFQFKENVMKLLTITLIALTTMACSKQPTTPESKVISIQQERYEIVHVDQPKHFWVNLKHIETGYVFQRTASSKHCNRWREFPVGTVIYVRTIRYENNTFGVDSRDANNVICG
jgi:hypothetical protein